MNVDQKAKIKKKSNMPIVRPMQLGKLFSPRLDFSILILFFFVVIFASNIGKIIKIDVFAQGLVSKKKLEQSRNQNLQTQLERRLVELRAHWKTPPSKQDWQQQIEMIDKLDPIKDAQTDVKNGIIGLMLRSNMSFSRARETPGVKCHNQDIARKDYIFIYRYPDGLSKIKWEALKSFEYYAVIYNQYIIGLKEFSDLKCSQIDKKGGQ